MKKILSIFIIVFLVGNTLAQNSDFLKKVDSIVEKEVAKKTVKPSNTQFMIRGYAHAGINYFNKDGEKESSFQGATFAPIFLFKHSDRLMFETELEFQLEGNKLDIGLEYGDVMYVLTENITIRAGKFLLPFGTFMERLHPSWINRLSTRPLGFGHDGITPGAGIGVELRGAYEIGKSKINYALYTTNGPRLKDGSVESEEAGMLLFQNFEDNNLGKAFGGRIGLLPFNDSSLELGTSIYSVNSVGDQDSYLEGIGAFLYALDFSFVKQISSLSGVIDIKAQYNNSKVDKTNYTEINEVSGLEEEYTFNNLSSSFYSQLSYRPTMLENNFLKKIEIVGRYSSYNTPEGAKWEETSKQYTFGLNYWLSWRSLMKISYQNTNKEGGHDTIGKSNLDGFFIHWAIGF